MKEQEKINRLEKILLKLTKIMKTKFLIFFSPYHYWFSQNLTINSGAT